MSFTEVDSVLKRYKVGDFIRELQTALKIPGYFDSYARECFDDSTLVREYEVAQVFDVRL